MDSCIPHQLLVHVHFRIFPCRDRAFACRHMQMHLDSHSKLKFQNIWVANSRVCARAAACEKMAACGRRVKVLIVALVISVCVLLYFWLRVTSLMSEADGVRLLEDDAVREQDRMKLNVSEGTRA